MQLYFAKDIGSSDVILDKEESHHVVQVVRKKSGEEIFITDGKGKICKAVITIANPKQCELKITENVSAYQHPYYLHIAIAPTKNIDRFEWFIEKAVEIGINEISPVICRRSERKNINNDRLNKLMIAAAKQSVKPLFPVLNELRSFNEVVVNAGESQKYIALCDEKLPLLKNIYTSPESLLVMIGPEGDFHEDELSFSHENNFKGISLGGYRLRTETAALVACNTISLLNQL